MGESHWCIAQWGELRSFLVVVFLLLLMHPKHGGALRLILFRCENSSRASATHHPEISPHPHASTGNSMPGSTASRSMCVKSMGGIWERIWSLGNNQNDVSLFYSASPTSNSKGLTNSTHTKVTKEYILCRQLAVLAKRKTKSNRRDTLKLSSTVMFSRNFKGWEVVG